MLLKHASAHPKTRKFLESVPKLMVKNTNFHSIQVPNIKLKLRTSYNRTVFFITQNISE